MNVTLVMWLFCERVIWFENCNVDWLATISFTCHHQCYCISYQISTIWKHSYKGGEWKPYVNKSTGGTYSTACIVFL